MWLLRTVNDHMCVCCSYWKGNSSLEELLKVGSECEDAAWKLQKQTGERHPPLVGDALVAVVRINPSDGESMPPAGIDRIGLDGTLYDQILDFIFYLGLAPKRFQVTSPL